MSVIYLINCIQLLCYILQRNCYMQISQLLEFIQQSYDHPVSHLQVKRSQYSICVPFLILAYLSLVQVHQNRSFYSAKWFLLILYTFISNLAFHFYFYDSSLFLILDLVIKLGIVFIPEIINQSLEKVIAAFHLELIINLVRGFIMPQIFLLFTLMLQFIVNYLTATQQSQFRSLILNVFDKMGSSTTVPMSEPVYLKSFKPSMNIGVNCDLLTISMLNDEKRQKQILRLQLNHRKQSQSNQDSIRQASNLVSTKVDHGYDSFGSMKKTKQTYAIQKSNTDIGIIDEDQKFARASIEKQKYAESRVRHKSPQQRSSIKDQSEPSLILNKLDVSQYSDMFQEQQNNSDRKLVTKVQTIIEIAGLSSARLQIYNIQLYSNGQIKIVSLYGRQFERHRLVSMRPLKHGYYELKLDGGKVHSRKVKFRGSFEPFLQYLQPQKI